MGRYAVRQLAYMALTLLVVSCAVFVLNEFAPGDVARKLLGAYATQEQVEHLTQQLGLDRPVLVRYVEYMGDVLREISASRSPSRSRSRRSWSSGCPTRCCSPPSPSP